MLPLRRRDEDVLENAVREEFIVGVPSFDLDRESANAAPHRRLSARFAEIAFRRGESRTPRSAKVIRSGQPGSLRIFLSWPLLNAPTFDRPDDKYDRRHSIAA